MRNASENCFTVANRSAASFASAFVMADSACGASNSRVARTLRTGSVSTFAMIACALGPV
jgi:hypothetical protein